ncbi:MAG TPA: hypothetical protein VHQ46_04525 [Desulfobacteria bacterium]|nr:hypothetical protein [Desulfobacteria bacterium]
MDKKLWLFSLGSLLLFGTVVLSLICTANPTWAKYQKEYFQAQITQLHTKLRVTSLPQKKAELEEQISQWQKRKPQIVSLVLPDGRVERCQTCHLGLEEISASHPSNTFGCTVCHGGNGLSLDLNTAHADWYGQGHPDRLSVASLSCGGRGPNGQTCHNGNNVLAQNEVDLVKTSLMATKAGELSVVRQMFGLDKGAVVPGLGSGEPAEQYHNPLNGNQRQARFEQNCLHQCHQAGGYLPLFVLPGQKPTGNQTAPVKENVPGNGCATCHVLTNPSHTYCGGDVTISRTQKGLGSSHRLTTRIPFTQCNQCHNQGWHDPIKMQFTPRSDLSTVINHWQGNDQNGQDRVKDYYVPGEVFARCEVSLDCIDCHTRQDVMGDGHLYTSEYRAVHIQCQDCHGTIYSPPLSKLIVSNSDLAFEEGITNPVFPKLAVGKEIGLTHKGEELPFVRHQGRQWYLFNRVTGEQFVIPLVYGSGCRQDPAQQGTDACHNCHKTA